MPEFVLDHAQRWIDHFASQGHDATALAAGVEGAIYDLGGGLVAKVWRERGAIELERMQRFYADVAAAGLPFATPEIIDVQEVDGTSVTYERKLPGQPLQTRLRLNDREIGPAAFRCVVDVLRALATVPATASMRELAVLDEDRRYRAVLNRLATVSPFPDSVVHGDLLGGNILVNHDVRPVAVSITKDLTTRLARELGYPIEVLLIYQACYAVATSNAFTPDGSDGHFAWCIAQLRRGDITEVLGL